VCTTTMSEALIAIVAGTLIRLSMSAQVSQSTVKNATYKQSNVA
jgi:hypothetical protein